MTSGSEVGESCGGGRDPGGGETLSLTSGSRTSTMSDEDPVEHKTITISVQRRTEPEIYVQRIEHRLELQSGELQE